MDRQKVAVGMSGGVDSSVAAALLKEQGYDVTGVFIVAYNEPGCRTDQDRKDALAVATQLHYAAADLDLTESVRIVSAERYGASDAGLSSLVHQADMIIQPSRCEGFGMMMLAAVAARVPLVTTAITGQTDFLYDFPGWLGAPTDVPDRIAFEDGLAPVVAPEALARTLWAAMEAQPEMVFTTGLTDRTAAQRRWEWSIVLRDWVEWAQAWVEE